MTEQYERTNINSPLGPRAIASDTQLTLDDGIVIADSSAAAVTLTMPNAVLIPGNIFYIKAPSGAVNPVTLQGFNGQLIDGAATLVLSANQAGVILRSEGGGWAAFGQGGGGGAALSVFDDGVLVDPAVTTMDFIGAGVTVTPAGAGAVDITIPAAGGIPSGAIIPEGVVPGTPGSLYIRISGTVSTFWQYLGAVPGVVGWRAIGPRLTGAPVGVIDGVNTVFTFPGGSEAVHSTAAPNAVQIYFEFNGIEQTETVDFAVTPGSVPGTTITSVVLTVPPVLGDILKTTFIPA